MKNNFFWGQVHKWIGIVVGLQVLLWIAGGVVMTIFPIEEVRSEHNIRQIEPQPIDPEEIGVPIAQILTDRQAVRADLTRVLDQAVWIVHADGGGQHLVAATDGALLSPISGMMAQEIASADFTAPASPSPATWLEATNTEYRGPVPVWRVDMNDEGDTHLYVAPQTGQIVARRSDVWRLFDFFWMLHIMDYENRTDFNHPLVIWASIIALVLSISGIVLIFYRFTRRDIAWFRRK